MSMDERVPVKTRRRGAELERALLDAAWEQLAAEGYSRFTIESVAERAHTAKHVIYRRWSDREALLVAAIRNHGSQVTVEPPDTGDLRLDVLTSLRRANTAESNMAVLFGAMIGSHFGELDMTPAQLRAELIGDRTSSTRLALDHAVARGEVNPARITPRMVTMPFDLFRNEYLMRLDVVPDSVLEEIVDELWLPLVRR
jgi:AcrR family transcriptional regulator